MGLFSCTSEPQPSKPFTVDGRKVVLFDTPGFNDANMSDTEVLRKIAAILERKCALYLLFFTFRGFPIYFTRYQNGARLTGIIYFHRISDERFTGIDVRNFGVFRKLCGDDTLKNVVIATNMWGKVNLEVGKLRERQLSAVFFKPAIDKGARLLRHVGDIESAHSIIRAILDNHPLTLQIQEELVDKQMEFPLTAAGEEIRRGLNEHARELEVKIKKLQSQMQNADSEERGGLKEEIGGLQERLDATRLESRELGPRYQEQRVKMGVKMDIMMGDLAIALGGMMVFGFVGGLMLVTLGMIIRHGGFERRVRTRAAGALKLYTK